MSGQEGLKNQYDGVREPISELVEKENWPSMPGRIMQIPEPPSMGPTFEALHDYCRDQVHRIARDRASLKAAEDASWDQGTQQGDDKAREFQRVDWLRQGEQIALRNLLEYFGINHD